MLALRVGQRVGFGEKGRFGRRAYKEGVIRIRKINTTKIVVEVVELGRGCVSWNVPADMLTPVGDASP